jgi:glycosyltransferase involved in cell wall biosynthesis
MLTDRSIICVANDWGGDPTSKTHIMAKLAARNRVLWVNSFGMRRPAASRRDLRRIVVKLAQGLRVSRRVTPSLHVYHPLVLPLLGSPKADRLNAWILATTIRRLSGWHGLSRPLLWAFVPTAADLVGRLGEQTVVYHCVDQYAAFAGVPSEVLRRKEIELVRRADVVFASSEELVAERRPLNPHTHFVSHGVDVEHFARARRLETPVPADTAALRRPLIGFFGLLADWVDVDLVRTLALAEPGWTIVLVGKIATDVRTVRDLPNVRLLGQRPYESLPGYCRAFDVGIIPFRVNELTERANPLKLREYLAAGLPVVATDLPEVRKYRDVVRLASSPGAFAAQIRQALGDRDPARARRRQDAVRGESWEARVEELSAHIEAVEERRLARPGRRAEAVR